MKKIIDFKLPIENALQLYNQLHIEFKEFDMFY